MVCMDCEPSLRVELDGWMDGKVDIKIDRQIENVKVVALLV
jgi:hypothetical protein